jgi:glycosyltransferase involved in cell wall biosynthesis
MLVTVAICTWNRSKLLDLTLTGMRELNIPVGVEWELLVVNNNSPDDTDAVIEKHRALGKLPIRRLFEQKQGLSNARNCAIDAAQGELLIWTDDDVIVEPKWLEEYARVSQQHPEAIFFGGMVKPLFAISPPSWILDDLPLVSGAFALIDLGPEIRVFAKNESPYGANMGFRTPILRNRPFDHRLGRTASELLSGEETIYCERLASEGNTGMWIGTAVVHHHVPAERMTRDYLIRWFEGGAASFARVVELPDCPLLFGVPRYLWRKKLRHLLRRLKNVVLCRRSSLRLDLEAASLRGSMREFRLRFATVPKERSLPANN